MGLWHTIALAAVLAVLTVLIGILLYDRLAGRKGRYVARDLDWAPLFGVPTGVIDDTTPDLPSTLDRTGPGWEHVTTLSTARAVARWANRNEGKS
jgi:hypothetical protein